MSKPMSKPIASVHFLTGRQFPAVRNGEMVPHMERGLSLVLPLPAQGELFPASVSVPVHEVSSWQRGVLPPQMKIGVLHEMKRRNLRQIDVASRIGLSRPQLTNALHGRCGVGKKAAEALKAFVLEEAIPA